MIAWGSGGCITSSFRSRVACCCCPSTTPAAEALFHRTRNMGVRRPRRRPRHAGDDRPTRDSGGVRRLAVVAVRRWGDPEATYLLAGSALNLAGVVLTRAYQVPRNNRARSGRERFGRGNAAISARGNSVCPRPRWPPDSQSGHPPGHRQRGRVRGNADTSGKQTSRRAHADGCRSTEGRTPPCPKPYARRTQRNVRRRGTAGVVPGSDDSLAQSLPPATGTAA